MEFVKVNCFPICVFIIFIKNKNNGPSLLNTLEIIVIIVIIVNTIIKLPNTILVIPFPSVFCVCFL